MVTDNRVSLLSDCHVQGMDPWVILKGLQCCPEQWESFSAKHESVIQNKIDRYRLEYVHITSLVICMFLQYLHCR